MENSKLRATPAARDLAKMMGVDLLNVRGSGAKGRIHKEDVEEFNFEKKVRITPLASKIAQEYNIDLKGKDVLVIGQSNIVGKPMSLLLMQKHATVQTCNSKTKNLSEKLQKADVVVAAAGSPKLVKASDVKEDVVVIDVGINRVDGKLCGDVDFEEVSKKASFITPVPGGVGPMTIAMLIKNTFKSYKQKIDK